MNKRILFSLSVALFLVALAIGGCQPAAPDAEVTDAPAAEQLDESCTVKVGAPIMITGVGAAMGLEIKDGAELATVRSIKKGLLTR